MWKNLTQRLRSGASSYSISEKGMTLVEIMIVLAILGGLIAILVPRFSGQLEKGRVKEAKIQMGEITKQLEFFNTDCGFYPTSEQGLEALVNEPQGEPQCMSWGPQPYMKKVPTDPWGKRFEYESDGTNFVIRSYGKDRREGGEGYDKDISSEDI